MDAPPPSSLGRKLARAKSREDAIQVALRAATAGEASLEEASRALARALDADTSRARPWPVGSATLLRVLGLRLGAIEVERARQLGVAWGCTPHDAIRLALARCHQQVVLGED